MFLRLHITICVISLVVSLPIISIASNSYNSERVFHQHSQTFSFTPGAQRVSEQVSNNLLQLISEGNQKLRVFTSYMFHCELHIQPLKLENNIWVLDLDVRNPRVAGDVTYRHFALDELLIPPLVDMELVLRQKDDETIHHLHFKYLPWQDKSHTDTVLRFSFNGKTAPEEIVTEIISINFKYPESLNQEIDFTIAALASYYKAEENINTINGLIEGLDKATHDQVILDEFRLCEAEALAGRMAHAPFNRLIEMRDKDPLNVSGQLQAINNRLSRLRGDFNFVISHMDSLLYLQGQEFLLHNEPEKARQAFERVLAYNPLYIPAHICLAEFEMNEQRPADAMKRLSGFMGKMPPPARWIPDAQSFASYIFEKEIERAAGIIEEGRYLFALGELESLENFCNSIVLWDCPDELIQCIAQGHYGMYESYLRVARRAYESENYSFAITYAENAKSYRNENASYIAYDGETMQLLQMIADGYFRKADVAYFFNDFAREAELLTMAKDLCVNYVELNCREDIDVKIADANERKALAEIMRLEYVITDPIIYSQLTDREQAMEFVKENLSLGHLRAWAGEVVQARSILNQVAEYAIKYDLRTDTLINMRIISLTEMIKDKECELAEREMRELLNLIPGRIRSGQYIQAYSNFNQVIQLQQKSDVCPWNYADSIEKFTHVKLLATYQELLQEAHGAYFRGAQTGFDSFLQKYTATTGFFEANRLERYGAAHEALENFILGSSNIALMRAGVEYYASINEHNTVLQILDELKLNRIDPRELRDLLEYSGKKAAAYLSFHSPEIQPRTYAREITGNDSWYRYYVRSFISNWQN
ncbi:MAG: hypothetical protein EA393_10760 [Bacteroidetes bacterium]|nr:MAG: hypothetical protein EA393_10760 [Bacteroidota bacterium]